MMLLSLHVENFGKLSGFDLNFTDGINEIYQPNGFGKTTLTRFLKAMFFGMAKRGNNKPYAAERSRYQPWQGGVYGGFVQFSHCGKNYQVTRTFGKTPESDTFELIDLSTNLKSSDFDENLGYQLFGVGGQTFEITAFLPQEGAPVDVNDEVRASLTGSNKFDSDLATLSAALKSLQTGITQTKAQCPKQAEIDAQKSAQIMLENRLNELSKQKKAKDEELTLAQSNLAALRTSTQGLAENKHRREECMKGLAVAKEKFDNSQKYLNSLKEQQMALLAEQNNILKNAPKKSTIYYIVLILGVLLAGVMLALGFVIKTPPYIFFALAGACFGLSIIYFIVAFTKKNKLVALFGAKNQVASERLGKIQTEIEEAQKECSQLESKFLTAQSEFDSLPQIDENLLEKINLEEQKIASIKTEIKLLGRSVSEQENLLEKCTSDLDSCIERKGVQEKKLSILEKTKAFLEQARENVSSRFVMPLQESFDKFFNYIDSVKGGQIKMDSNLAVSEVAPSGLMEVEYLSTGYKDLISLCKRLALIENIFTRDKPFVIIDDALVNFDDKKLSLAKEVLNGYAKNYQIIYLCAHSRNRLKM